MEPVYVLAMAADITTSPPVGPFDVEKRGCPGVQEDFPGPELIVPTHRAYQCFSMN
jgi:hypothetical protein